MTSTEEVKQVGRPMRKDAARNRELLIAAGREVFAKRGLEASLDDIAHHAGVGVGTAYRHFGNKFELAEAIMRTAVDEVLAAAEHALLVEDPWQGLVGFLEAILEVQTKDRGLREFMVGLGNPHKSEEVYELLGRPFRAILDRAHQAGLVRTDFSTTDLGCMLAMLCEVSDLAADADPQLWRRYFGILLAGMRPDGAPLTGEALSEEQFRAASEQHQGRRMRPAQ